MSERVVSEVLDLKGNYWRIDSAEVGSLDMIVKGALSLMQFHFYTISLLHLTDQMLSLFNIIPQHSYIKYITVPRLGTLAACHIS